MMIGTAQEIAGTPLHFLGGSNVIDGRLSWRGDGDIGLYEHMNCYVLGTGDDAVMVETGVPFHNDAISAGLRQILGGNPLGKLAITRIEPDCLSNILSVSQEFGLRHIFAPGALDPLDFFEDLNAEALMRTYQLECDLLRAGDSIISGESHRLEVIAPPLRILATQWLYDPAARIMFCSDSFSHFASYSPHDRVVTAENLDRFHADPKRHLLTKFDWLGHADRQPLANSVRDIFARHPTHTLAPTRGAVIHGEELVSDQVAAIVAALETV